jgi:hypothetical protein
MIRATASRRSGLLVSSLLVLLLAAPSPAPAARSQPDPMWTAERIAKMVAAYHQALPGKIRVLSLKIWAHRAEMTAQDPAQPENVDEYRYHGKVDSPIPVHLVGKGSLESNLFDLDSVALDRIPDLVDQAPAKVGLSDAQVGHVLVKRNLPFSKDVQIVVYLDGTRKGGLVKADAQGNVIEVKVH